MIRITITAAAFEAIAATLPSSVGVEQKRAANGDYHIWLEHRFVDRLRAMRGPGESYSDVILRLAGGDGSDRQNGRRRALFSLRTAMIAWSRIVATSRFR